MTFATAATLFEIAASGITTYPNYSNNLGNLGSTYTCLIFVGTCTGFTKFQPIREVNGEEHPARSVWVNFGLDLISGSYN